LSDFNESEKNKFINFINSVKPCCCFSDKETHEKFNELMREQKDIDDLFDKIKWYEYEGLEEKYVYVIPMGNGKNLRVATQQENMRNRKMSSNNTSGHRGVSYDKRNKKWLAYIGHNHKHINLGMYNNFGDAVKAREEAEEKYFGEFAYKEFKIDSD
jgi:hypothetical protein